MTSLTLAAPAKVNLYLEVLGRRPDGFHELVTVLHALELADDVTVTRRERRDDATPGAPDVTLRITAEDSSTADLPTGPENLAWRAAAGALLRADAVDEVGFDVALHKRIPAGGGLGGGSSDAAAVVRAADELLGHALGADGRQALCAELGSDVPFFLHGGTALALGRGERVEPVAPPRAQKLVLGLPPFGVSTPAVYGALDAGPLRETPPGHIDELLSRLANADADGVAALYRNDLAAAAARVEPRLATILAGDGVLLSGSGSTVFRLVSSDAGGPEAPPLPGIPAVRTRSAVR